MSNKISIWYSKSILVDYFPDAAAYYLQVFPCNKCIKTKKSGAGEKKEKRREEIYQEIGEKKNTPPISPNKKMYHSENFL